MVDGEAYVIARCDMARVVAALVYIQIGLFTGTWYYQHVAGCRISWHGSAMCTQEADSFAVGILWPAYWNYKLAMRLTK